LTVSLALRSSATELSAGAGAAHSSAAAVANPAVVSPFANDCLLKLPSYSCLGRAELCSSARSLAPVTISTGRFA